MHALRWKIGRRVLIWLIHLAIFACSGATAFLVCFELALSDPRLHDLLWAAPVWVVTKAAIFRALKLDRGWWHHASEPDMLRVGAGNLLGSAVSAAIIMAVTGGAFRYSLIALDLMICTYLTAGVRVLVRVLKEHASREAARGGKRIVIYGAGVAGVTLLREIRNNARLAYEVCGFVDDDPEMPGMRVEGVPVLGTGADMGPIAAAHNIELALIAIPSADGPAMTRILGHCHQAGVTCKTVPGLGDILSDRGLEPQIRDVNVEDLLGRKPIRIDESAIRVKLEDQVVMVTGAAGSIGSEICRQVARFQPRAIVAFDVAETPLFHLDQEMRAKLPHIAFHPEIGNIQNSQRLAEVMQAHRPSVLYHAAAYKHVPMMESAVFAAVENNILGTATVAEAAARYGVTDFVMISSDKAVRPTNVMGLTKRVAELLIASMQNGRTKYVSVRFGNVLGSNGSVIPTFKRQIADGGPVTVTHPEMRRYFMTIPEAVQLVLQASAMSRGGEIFVLDMGQPVKILDLARNLILLSGLRPGRDVEIKVTGLRPGEKLYEELSTLEENTLPTYHEKIKIFEGPVVEADAIEERLRRIRSLCSVRSERRLIIELKDLVPEYNPSVHVLKRLVEVTKPVEVAVMRTAFATAGDD